MREIEVIFSPICEASGAFLRLLSEWLENTNVKMVSMTFDTCSERQKKLYSDNGILVNGKMTETCFVDVFYENKLIDSVPLSKKRIFSALGIDSIVEEIPAPLIQPKLVLNDEVIWIPITKDTYLDEMTMCLTNYPYGNPPERFYKQCIEIKKQVFMKVWEKQSFAGLYAKYKDKVIGLIEVFPREILRENGFLTGSTGCDEEYLTVGCLEVGAGITRIEMIDELMQRLLTMHHMFSRPRLEGIGVYEWPDGFTPYWVYDKYGFHRSETISERKVVMEKCFI